MHHRPARPRRLAGLRPVPTCNRTTLAISPLIDLPAATALRLVVGNDGTLHAPLGAATAVPVDQGARALCEDLAELLGRPIELLSVRSNPVGPKHLVTVATREVTPTGSELRSGAAAAHDPVAALTDALAAAHLAGHSLLAAATRRLVDDRVVRSAVLAESGVERAFGVPDASGMLSRLAGGGPPSPTEARVRVLAHGSTVLAVTVADDAGDALLHLWWRAVSLRSETAPIAIEHGS